MDRSSAGDRERVAEEWARAVLGQTSTLPYARAASVEVMNVLARMPADEGDGIWPNVVARRLLKEEQGALDRANALRLARFNARGVTQRAVGAGGEQERTLQGELSLEADEIADAWPQTARMLRDLGAAYMECAARWDETAEGRGRLGPVEMAAGLLLAARPDLLRRPPALSDKLGASPREARRALARLAGFRIVDLSALRVDVVALVEQLRTQTHARQELPEGDDVAGVLTGIAPTSLRASLPLENGERAWVWPLEGGPKRGRSVDPLCPSVPALALRSPLLHTVFALLDVVRYGRGRERLLALDGLRQTLLDRDPRTSAA